MAPMSLRFFKLRELEERVGDLYFEISRIFEKENPRISEIFFELYRDEQQHCRQVELAGTLWSESEKYTTGDIRESEKIEAALNMVEDVKKMIRKKKDELKPADYLKIAQELEEDFAEGHHLLSIQAEDETIKNLLMNLIREDQVHVNRIKRFLDEEKGDDPVETD